MTRPQRGMTWDEIDRLRRLVPVAADRHLDNWSSFARAILQAASKVIDMLPAFGSSFEINDNGKLAMPFDPKRLGPALGRPPVGLEEVGS